MEYSLGRVKGSIWYTGTNIDEVQKPIDGDFFLNTENYALYVYKEKKWELLTNLDERYINADGDTFKGTMYMDVSKGETPHLIGKHSKIGIRALDESGTMVGQFAISDSNKDTYDGHYASIQALGNDDNLYSFRVSKKGAQFKNGSTGITHQLATEDYVDDNFMNLSEQQKILGEKTFESINVLNATFQGNVTINKPATSAKDVVNKEYVDEQITKIPKFAIEVVSELPSADKANTTTVYLLNVEDKEGNIYEEYIYVIDEETKVGSWELLGTAKVDLSNYYTKEEADVKYVIVDNGKANISYDKNFLNLDAFSKSIEIGDENNSLVIKRHGLTLTEKKGEDTNQTLFSWPLEGGTFATQDYVDNQISLFSRIHLGKLDEDPSDVNNSVLNNIKTPGLYTFTYTNSMSVNNTYLMIVSVPNSTKIIQTVFDKYDSSNNCYSCFVRTATVLENTTWEVFDFKLVNKSYAETTRYLTNLVTTNLEVLTQNVSNNYYTKEQADERYINVNGDSFTNTVYMDVPEGSTPYLIGTNHKIGIRANDEHGQNVGQISISDSYWDKFDGHLANMTAEGSDGKHYSLYVSKKGPQFKDGETEIIHQLATEDYVDEQVGTLKTYTNNELTKKADNSRLDNLLGSTATTHLGIIGSPNSANNERLNAITTDGLYSFSTPEGFLVTPGNSYIMSVTHPYSKTLPDNIEQVIMSIKGGNVYKRIFDGTSWSVENFQFAKTSEIVKNLGELEKTPYSADNAVLNAIDMAGTYALTYNGEAYILIHSQPITSINGEWTQCVLKSVNVSLLNSGYLGIFYRNKKVNTLTKEVTYEVTELSQVVTKDYVDNKLDNKHLYEHRLCVREITSGNEISSAYFTVVTDSENKIQKNEITNYISSSGTGASGYFISAGVLKPIINIYQDAEGIILEGVTPGLNGSLTQYVMSNENLFVQDNVRQIY